eukprot:gene22777-27062_t
MGSPAAALLVASSSAYLRGAKLAPPFCTSCSSRSIKSQSPFKGVTCRTRRPFSLAYGRDFAELFSAHGPQPFITAMEVRIMKTLLNMAVAATLLAALPAWACTLEEATAKREQLAKEVTKLTQQNPEK